MSKKAKDIIKWGTLRPFLDKTFKFNTIDLETVDNEMFLFGFIKNGNYEYVQDNYYQVINDLLIDSVRNKRDILTWSRYDNTHIVKVLLDRLDSNIEKENILLKAGKVSPVYVYNYGGFEFSILNIIKDSMIFSLKDKYGKKRRVTIYNLKNIFTSDLETTAKNYKIDTYSKLGVEYHIIDETRYNKDLAYKNMVIKSNRLDNEVLIDIAVRFLENFKLITGYYPNTIFTAGSIARSYMIAYNLNNKESPIDLTFMTRFKKSKLKEELLDYSMRAYHGGKIESYILGYVKNAKTVDITSAYPYAMTNLPMLLNDIVKVDNKDDFFMLNHYYYAYINCDIYIDDKTFIHPISIKNPLNNTNISPYGYLKDVVITKLEYDFLIQNNIQVVIHNFIAIEHLPHYPYKPLIDELFNMRIKYQNEGNTALADLFKVIINSMYGITYELTEQYDEVDDEIKRIGLRAGDFFNPVIAGYITAQIRVYLSKLGNNIIKNNGDVYLMMTDSVLYSGEITLPYFSENKVLGTLGYPDEIKDLIVLGAGRYEYKDVLKDKYVIKNRGFNVSVKEEGFYNKLDLNSDIEIEHKTFISMFRATTKYGFDKLGHLLDDTYNINPFNLGGKRVIDNHNVNLNKEYTKTSPIFLDRDIYLSVDFDK